MRRRLRKKLRLREFRELGFVVQYQAPPSLSDDARIDLLCAFLEGAIEPRGLGAGGGGADLVDVFVSASARRVSATEEDQRAVAGWLSANKILVGWRVGVFRDAWHGDFDEPESSWAFSGGCFG